MLKPTEISEKVIFTAKKLQKFQVFAKNLKYLEKLQKFQVFGKKKLFWLMYCCF